MKQFTPEHGQFVTCEINGVKIKNARVSVDEEYDGDYIYVCHNSRKANREALVTRPKSRLGYNYSWCVYAPYVGYIPSRYNLQPATPRKTKAEKVREARAKKKGLFDHHKGVHTCRGECTPDKPVKKCEKIRHFSPNPYNKYNCASCGAIVTTHLLENPYKELVEKVKEKCVTESDKALRDSEVIMRSIARLEGGNKDDYHYQWQKYTIIKELRDFINQEEKKINK